MAHGGWKWKTKQNIMWFSQTPIMSMYDLDIVSDVVPDVVPHLNGLPSKQFKARIRCGGAANYGPRITEYIAEYYGVFNTAHFVQKGWFYHSAALMSDVGNLAKSEARFLPFHRHHCNACTVYMPPHPTPPHPISSVESCHVATTPEISAA